MVIKFGREALVGHPCRYAYGGTLVEFGEEVSTPYLEGNFKK